MIMWIAECIKQIKCKHELEYEEEQINRFYLEKLYHSHTVVSVVCKKCGYHKTYKKF